MQLKSKTTSRKNKSIAGTLGLMTASLLANSAMAQSTETDAPIKTNPQVQSQQPVQYNGNVNDDTYTDEGLTRLDGAVLIYQEDGGRVQAIEPVMGVTFNGSDGQILSLHLTADILTGASPFGATPWKDTQTFVAGIKTDDGGGSTGSSGQATVVSTGNGISTISTDVPADTLPLADGFNDKRYALDVAYTMPMGPKSKANFGAGGSFEKDYQSIFGNVGYSVDMNQKNTTFDISANFEFDKSKPNLGNPTPLTEMSSALKNGNENKTVIGGLVGITQVMNRRWLAQLNYTISHASGYQTDPYRILSVVDPVTGGPSKYLYESRPDKRTRQSIYFGNKIAFGDTVTDLSVRGYHDDWGVNSLTLNASEHIPFGRSLYFEPAIRYYSQSAADFFNYFLLDNVSLPDFASSDSRLDKFSAVTPSLLVGYKIGKGEIYARYSHYKPTGKNKPLNAPGYLNGRDLFTGASSDSFIVGYSYAFR